MVKHLLLLAITAYVIFIVPSSANGVERIVSYSKTSSSSRHTSSSSHSVTTSDVQISPTGPCSHGHEYQHTSSSSKTSSSSSSHISSSSSSFSIGSVDHPIHHPDCRECRANERWVQCPEAVCVPKTCDDVGLPVPCYDLRPNGKCPSKPACICNEGLVRNSQGFCVPMKQCPSCGGDPNAVSGCRNDCNMLCSNYHKTNVSCAQGCFNNACECKQGFVFDEITKKCVLPLDCPPPVICKRFNEVYDPCPASCPFRTCGINDAAVSCAPALPTGHPDCAPPRCRCKDGFYRNQIGDCVRWRSCPTCNRPNETYDPCPAPCPPRRCDVNEALILCMVPPQLGDPECRPGCRCIDGYVKDYTGACIPKDQCPKCTAPNEVFDACIAPCPPRRCDVDERLIRCAAPPKLGDPLCEAGCRCADGYKRNSEGLCIPADQCPKCTKPHEVFQTCPTDCPPQTCESIGKKYNCSQNNTHKGRIEVTDVATELHLCDGKCVCEEGYYRNKIGECISKQDCLKCTGPNEFFSCGSACDNVCGLLDKQNQTNCPIINIVCNPRCYCEQGYARDENHICIPIKDCKVPQCGPDERYEICPPFMCQPMNCTQVGFPIACPGWLGPGCPGKSTCVCKDDYVRNDRGVCIPKNQCLSCGGDPNAQAGCGNCNRHCSDIGKEPGACILSCKLNDCECKKGYYYDDKTKRCVKPEDCSKGPFCLESNNEVYSDCISGGCQAKNCSQYNKEVPCVKIDSKHCIKGCLCKEGYLRAANGKCIPKGDCPEACKGPNEEYNECSWGCPPQTCDSLDRAYACPLINGNDCRPMCKCKPGYYRNKIGQCITEQECRRCMDGPNEYYSCGGACDNVCKTLHIQSQDNCPIINVKCNEMCYCERGYARAKNNTCIPISSCNAPQCPVNERYSECVQGNCSPQNCTQLGSPLPCPLIDARYCRKGCICIEGYVRNENGLCIPTSECPLQCPKNEVHSDCIQGDCGPQNCTQLGFPIPCPRIDPKYCKKGCLCAPGYVRNKKGICIPSKECPSCRGDPNAQSGCGGNCNRHCSDIGKGPFMCTLSCEINGCDCREGYYYDDNAKRCVKPEDCNKGPICLESNNEVYSDCINGGCQAKNCSQYNKEVPCVKIDPKHCIKGCLCKEGYLRAANGKCIPKGDCPEACNRPNEEYNECSFGCPPQTCESLDRAYVCPITEENDCKPMCQCKPGYFRNKIGECITEKQCRMCMTGPNEYYSCGGACDNVCKTLHIQSQDNCPIINVKCNEMCYCERGYARAKNNTCIPISSCHESQCPLNEKYERCPDQCKPQHCAQLGYPIDCPISAAFPGFCTLPPDCVCIHGYVRNDAGTCIPIKECPSCGGDCNAQSGCGTNCRKRCTDLGKEVTCYDICHSNACDCRDGYHYDSNQMKCVLARECTDICAKNEVFEDCSNPICRPKGNCNQLGFPVNCTTKCQKGCVCRHRFSRHDNGTCVPLRQCPSCGGDPNAESGCGVKCGRRCSDIGKNIIDCPHVCSLNGCDCKKGFHYDEKTNKCVKPEDCTKGPECLEQNNEVYSDCINGGCGWKNCSQYGKPVPCVKIDPKNCIRGCLCKEGYLRASNGICIPQQHCPEACNGPNEEYDKCTFDCPPRTCESIDRAYICPIREGEKCKAMCRCKPGYFRSKTGQCITEKQCRMCPGRHEYYACGGACDNVCKTLHQQNQTNCPIVNIKCNEMCYCEAGYARDEDNVCIPINQCNHTKRCNGPNEEYNACTFDCPPRTCESLDKAYVCPIREGDKCKAMCRCKTGYFRSKTGQCITEKQCRMCPGPHEFYACGGACDNVCKTLHQQNQTNCPIVNIKCNEMCYCKAGYARDENNICIPISQCNHTEHQCPINETYEKCPAAICKPHKCSELGMPIACPAKPLRDKCPTKPACVCVDGYVRDHKGKCIPKEDCPSCGGDINAVSACGVNCGKNCKDLGKDGVSCIEICYFNSCDCKDGYYYDTKQKKCVLPGQCTDICGMNEVFEDCSNPMCSAKNCSQLGLKLDCNAGCLKGCVCKDGYARDNKGICIPVKQCPSCGGDKNAETGCGINCLKKCYDLHNPDRPRPCPKICKINDCDCKQGYYLDENINKCVTAENCSPTCKENEMYTPCANGGCEMKNCSQLGGPQLCIDPIKCIGGCICKKGYLRLENGTCVPIDECPTPSCNKNERFSLCPAKECQPQTCKEIGFPINCTDAKDKCPGHPACICDYGYVRNNKGICRPKSECPSCGGDPNAKSGCGINCGKRCPNNNLNTKLCPRICLPNACDCKDNFYFDANIKKCVELKHCSPRCEEIKNEVIDPCVNGGCGWRKCSEVGGPILCIDPIKCNTGCKCREGYYRLENGTCVPENQCPLKCWGPNEVYDPCPPKCPPQICESIGQIYFCPKINKTDCKGQCRCKHNFYRNKIGECIHAKDCLKCPDPHAYFSCGPACDNVCSKLDTESKDNCPIKNIKCVPRCYCEDGYAQNENGTCIPIHQCPGHQTTTSTSRKPTVTTAPSTNATLAIAKFERGNQALAGEFLYQLLVSRPGETFMVSGFSVLILLAQLALYAVGPSSQQLMHLLNLDTKDEIRTIFPILIKNYREQQEVIFRIANKYYTNVNAPVTDNFKREAMEVFDSDAQSLDFSNNVQAADTINRWVEEKTNGLIQDLVSPDVLSGDTRSVLTNALYFLGNWEKQFNKNDTKPSDFHISENKTVSLDTMHQQGRFRYAEINDLDCKILELPYKGGNFTFVIYLPNTINGLQAMIEKLRNPDNFYNSIGLLAPQTVRMSIPVIDATTDISNMADLLKKVNVTAPFDSSIHNFEGIIANGEELYISDTIQKTKIIVDETGTEAAAATAAIVGTTSVQNPPPRIYDFNCNHPSAFFLLLGDVPLFYGVYAGA